MAVYDLEEQEQLDELKTWWKQYGNLVTGVIVAAALAVLGWQGWNWWQRNQAEQASVLYSGVQAALSQHDAKRTRELAGELIDKYAGTAYAGMAALLSAKVQADGGDLKSAQAQLVWAAENATDDALRDVARLRIAALLLDAKDYAAAQQQLGAEPRSATFAPRFNELRGDISAAQGRTVEARAAYDAALSGLKAKDGAAPSHVAYRDMLQAKIDALGGAK